MQQLEQQIRTLLREMGADLIGFGDVEDLAPDGYRRAISIAKALPAHVLEQEVPNGPTQEYVDRYRELSGQLEQMAEAVEALLTKAGYRTVAVARLNAHWQGEFSSAFPYKTCATRAGLGWIGKCNLLVTPECGAGIRLSAVLTDAPLTAAEPISSSRCGNCTQCVDLCPAHALKNTLWNTQLTREDIIDIRRCHDIAADIAEQKMGVHSTICGKCFAACPYTKAYLRKAKANG